VEVIYGEKTPVKRVFSDAEQILPPK